jgi:steroid delta-isomerase-like uncharacterized protein
MPRWKALDASLVPSLEADDFAAFDELVAVDYDEHLAGATAGRENLKKYFRGLRKAFPDLTLPIVAMVAEGDLVAVLNQVRGTHLGDFAGVLARGNPIDAQAFQLYRIAGGQLAEHWEVADFTTLLKQMGA